MVWIRNPVDTRRRCIVYTTSYRRWNDVVYLLGNLSSFWWWPLESEGWIYGKRKTVTSFIFFSKMFRLLVILFIKVGKKKAKHAKFSEKQTFLTTWYAHVHVRIRGEEMFVFLKIWRVLLSCYLRFEIRPFALLPTNYFRCKIWSKIFEKQPLDVLCKKGVLRNFTKFTGNACAQ